MLNKKQISEIKEHLESAQNPLFLFDNDQDGLSSFLLFQRAYDKGKGFPVKSIPLEKDYFRKVEELNPDYIFILDVAEVSGEFLEEVHKLNLPVVWIDHHAIQPKSIPKWINYYNPLIGKKIQSSTVYLCSEVVGNKDLWLVILGSVSDHFVPESYKEFQKEYPDLSIDSDDPKDILYNSDIGKVAQLLGYGLKDRTTNVIKMIKFLMKVRTPYEILQESKENKIMHEKFNEVDKKYKKFMTKAKEQVKPSDKLVIFEYGGNTSMSAALGNGLKYLYPDKVVFVCYINQGFVNISGRGNNVKNVFEKVLKQLDNAKGGGHEKAVGGRIMSKDLEKFRSLIEKELK